MSAAPGATVIRPLITTPGHLQPADARRAEAARLARQPGLGLVAGLLFVIPFTVLLAFGAGGASGSVLVLSPLTTFALPVAAVIAFWWEDWPGTRLRSAWAGWADTVLVVRHRRGLVLREAYRFRVRPARRRTGRPGPGRGDELGALDPAASDELGSPDLGGLDTLRGPDLGGRDELGGPDPRR